MGQINVIDLELVERHIPDFLKPAVFQRMLLDPDITDAEAIGWVVSRLIRLNRQIEEVG